MAQYFERGDNRGPAIPYRILATLLFADDRHGTQQLVPFLGAGASIGGRPPENQPEVSNPAPAEVDRFTGALGLAGTAARFMELAARLAVRIQASEQAALTGRPRPDPFTAACNAKYPPSATELAAALAFRAVYDTFERPRRRIQPLLDVGDKELVQLLTWIADLTEIGPSVPPLLSVASFYQYTSPKTLWPDLKQIFQNKTTPTRTHWLTARAALAHLAQEDNDKDYLIVTTNYDCLMEKALESVAVPYCVLTVVSPDKPVEVRFSPNMQQYLAVKDVRYQALREEHSTLLPGYFTLSLRKPVAILFKLHGCLFPDSPRHQSVILSDEDYVRYIMQMHDGAMIPSEVSKYLQSPGFLFLGYSFSDWNVRAIYKSVIKKRPSNDPSESGENGPGDTEPKDYAVLREFSHYESALCRTNVHMLITDLTKFTRRTMAFAPKRIRKGAQPVH